MPLKLLKTFDSRNFELLELYLVAALVHNTYKLAKIFISKTSDLSDPLFRRRPDTDPDLLLF